jgi:hypothetical protein
MGIQSQKGMGITEHETQEHFRDDAAADWSQSRCAELLNRADPTFGLLPRQRRYIPTILAREHRTRWSDALQSRW